jgi:hypothetical protein
MQKCKGSDKATAEGPVPWTNGSEQKQKHDAHGSQDAGENSVPMVAKREQNQTMKKEDPSGG